MYFSAEEFGERVRLARTNRNMTQQELADTAHTQRNHISRIERGERNCSLDLLAELSEALKVSTDYLLKGTPDKKSYKEELDDIIAKLTAISQEM